MKKRIVKGYKLHKDMGGYRFSFIFEDTDEIVATIRILLNDYSNADVTITNMTTLPYKGAGNGYGSAALKKLIEFMERKNMRNIIATQVLNSEGFWIKNGFIGVGNITNDFRYLRIIYCYPDKTAP